MTLRFHKMHGAGNDFVLLDRREEPAAIDAEQVRALADRRTGIGCDQVLVLGPGEKGALASVAIWNADGSTAEQCGNGMRCIALYLHQRGDAPDGAFEVTAPAGRLVLERVAVDRARVSMGEPSFRAADLPANLPVAEDGWSALELEGGSLRLGLVSLGNPHAVLPVDDIDRAPVDRLGPVVSGHAAFPAGINVGFAEVRGRHELALRVWERGAGETLACGSGATAAAVLLGRQGRLDSPVTVSQRGGSLVVEWDRGFAATWLTGPAAYVFAGDWIQG